MVGDYFKVSEAQVFVTCTKHATELITWLQSKTQVLAMLRDIQKGINLANPSASHRILSVIQAILTRWTAHYLAYHRLLDLINPLKILVAHERGTRRE